MAATTGGLVYSDAEAIASSVPHVAGVAVEQSTTQTIKYSNIVLEDVSILGTTPILQPSAKSNFLKVVLSMSRILKEVLAQLC